MKYLITLILIALLMALILAAIILIYLAVREAWTQQDIRVRRKKIKGWS